MARPEHASPNRAPLDVLVSRRLTLRPPLEVDVEPIAELLDNLAVSRNLGPVPHPYTAEDAAGFVQRSRHPDKIVHTVHRERLIGVVGIDRSGGEPHFGYWFGEPFWGRGYATEAAAASLRFVFERWGCERMGSYVFADNPASLAVQRKLGAEIVGARERSSLARGREVAGFEMVLTRDAFERHHPVREAA